MCVFYIFLEITIKESWSLLPLCIPAVFHVTKMSRTSLSPKKQKQAISSFTESGGQYKALLFYSCALPIKISIVKTVLLSEVRKTLGSELASYMKIIH